MMDNAFNTINEFCKKNKHPHIYNRILLHKYYEDFYKIVEDHKKRENKNPSEDTIQGFQSTLLNEMTLQSNIKLATEEIQGYTKKEIDSHKLKISFKEFGFNVFAGVVASILFTLLLILFFYLGKNQINSWLNDLNDNKQNIENKNNK